VFDGQEEFPLTQIRMRDDLRNGVGERLAYLHPDSRHAVSALVWREDQTTVGEIDLGWDCLPSGNQHDRPLLLPAITLNNSSSRRS